MQDRRYRPGDVLDDYCPRERRITDHAIVAMIDDEIRRTRCGVCDAEHEYKEAKVPAPRRKTQPPALFTQVLDGLNGPAAPHPVAVPEPLIAATASDASAMPPAAAPDYAAFAREDSDEMPLEKSALAREASDVMPRNEPVETAEADEPVEPVEPGETAEPAEPEEGGFRRSLIRATFPRPDGQAPPQRSAPEFTIQSLHNRRNGGGQRHAGGQNKFRGGGGGRRRQAGGGSQDHLGPMRFRDHGHGQGQGQGNNNNQGQGQGGGRRRRGGKKNR